VQMDTMLYTCDKDYIYKGAFLMCSYKFPERLKQLREDLNLTQDEFAEKLNTFRATISRYENGLRTPDVAFAQKISKVFNVSMDWLTGRTDKKQLNLLQIYEIPSLKNIAIEYIEVIQEAYDSGLSAQELKEVLQMAIKLKG